MKKIKLYDLLNKKKSYNKLEKAYHYAKNQDKRQYRKIEKLYIIPPLNLS